MHLRYYVQKEQESIVLVDDNKSIEITDLEDSLDEILDVYNTAKRLPPSKYNALIKNRTIEKNGRAMTQGVPVFARNNDKIDYTKQA